MNTASSAPPAPSSLPRVLGWFATTALVVGTVIGSGVFKKPQAIAEAIPFSGVAALVWIAGGLVVLLGALAYAEIAVLFPRPGGNYVFLYEGYGRLAGFLWGWVEFWIIRAGSLAALATVFTESFRDILVSSGLHVGFWSQRGITVTVLVVLAAVNIRGVRWGSGLQVVITAVKIASLLGIAVLPWLLLGRAEPLPEAQLPDPANREPIWPDTWRMLSLAGLGTALLAVQWPYHGWMNIAPIAGEVQRPQRNIPIALLLGVAIIIALYLGASSAYYLALTGDEMTKVKNTPVATVFAERLLGPMGGVLLSAAIMCSVFGALNGNLLVGPRLLYAMGEDGLAPRWLRDIHPRYQTPANATAVLTGWACLLVVSVAVLTQTKVLTENKSHFDILTDFAMFGAVVFETLAVLTIFVFRRRMPDAERSYRCPGYPVVPILYAIVPLFVLVNMFNKEKLTEALEPLVGVAFIAAGALVYWGLGLGKSKATV